MLVILDTNYIFESPLRDHIWSPGFLRDPKTSWFDLVESALPCLKSFTSLEIASLFLILFSLFPFISAWTFISLQIKEVRIMGLSINDSVYSCLFFFLTGLHFFHLLLGLLLLSLLFWSCSFPLSLIFWFFCFYMRSLRSNKSQRRPEDRKR